MNIMPFFLIWACVVLALLGVMLYRKAVAAREDDFVHLGEGEAQAIPQQIQIAGKLEILDRWAKILAIMAVAGGALLGAVYLYQLWQQSSQLR